MTAREGGSSVSSMFAAFAGYGRVRKGSHFGLILFWHFRGLKRFGPLTLLVISMFLYMTVISAKKGPKRAKDVAERRVSCLCFGVILYSGPTFIVVICYLYHDHDESIHTKHSGPR